MKRGKVRARWACVRGNRLGWTTLQCSVGRLGPSEAWGESIAITITNRGRAMDCGDTSPPFLRAPEWLEGVRGGWVLWRVWASVKEQRCRALSITHKFGGLPPYPNGIAPQSPGLGGTSYPGENAIESTTPSWVANPVGLQVIPSATRDGVVRKPRLTQGRRSCVAPTLGFEPESLWDSNIWSKNLWVMLRSCHRGP